MPGEFGRLWIIFTLKFTMKESWQFPTAARDCKPNLPRDAGKQTEVWFLGTTTDSYETAIQSLGFTFFFWGGVQRNFHQHLVAIFPSNTACTRSSSFVDTNLLTNASNMWEVMVHRVYVDGWYDGMVWVAKACYCYRHQNLMRTSFFFSEAVASESPNLKDPTRFDSTKMSH